MIDKNKYQNIPFSRNINTISLHEYATSFPTHWHKYVEIVAFPKNAIFKQYPKIRINQTDYELAPGDIIFIWPGELHETVHNADHLLASIQFPSTLYSDLREFAPYLHLFRTIHHIHKSENPVLATKLMGYFVQIIHSRENRVPLCGVEAIIHVYEMLLELGLYVNNTLLNSNDTSEKNTGHSLDKISIACNFITENCGQHLTLNQAAHNMGFSPSYFSRMFKQITNYSFIEYLTIQRVKQAQFLLADSNLTITEISYQSGFKSISTFNRVFKQYQNCSPREYRKYYLTET
ncbi:MAG TPA: AraC family transcriptional regulator [Lachnospiraceae bacterium]|nr:AraC family transcriptional regulator [Lachnospiraceae bacterium]